MWYMVHGTGHSRAQMNNKDISFVHMAYSRLDWNPFARGVAGGGCKMSLAVIFTKATKKCRMRSRFVHACYTYTGWIGAPAQGVVLGSLK
jgi:hypothetical protein